MEFTDYEEEALLKLADEELLFVTIKKAFFPSKAEMSYC